MEEGITSEDIEQLCKENHVANEQLRRIRAERQVRELQAKVEELDADTEA